MVKNISTKKKKEAPNKILADDESIAAAEEARRRARLVEDSIRVADTLHTFDLPDDDLPADLREIKQARRGRG